MNLFVTAIGTGSGKTICSAIIASALEASYWKPVQCGDLDNSDAQLVEKLTAIKPIPVLKEKYGLSTPASPHFAAKQELITIRISDFQIPEFSTRHLIVEGAGGLLVPLNESETMFSLAQHLQCQLVVVCNYYLGCINHSLLTLKFLKSKGHVPAFVILNGEDFGGSREAILRAIPDAVTVLEIPTMNPLNSSSISMQANKLKPLLFSKLNELSK